MEIVHARSLAPLGPAGNSSGNACSTGEHAGNSTEPTERFVILAAVDEGPLDDEVVRASANFARMVQGEIHLVRVLEDLPLPVGFVPRPPGLGITTGEITASARKGLDELAAKAHGSGFAGRVAVHLAAGSASKQILQIASHVQADVILVGTHGRKGIKRMLLGSVAEAVVRRASCPVLVVRPKDYHAFLPPEIEPACTDCLRVQNETKGASLWCPRHSEHSAPGHTGYELPASSPERGDSPATVRGRSSEARARVRP
jgi:nucleotide-binding universal stress UspA family protein